MQFFTITFFFVRMYFISFFFFQSFCSFCEQPYDWIECFSGSPGPERDAEEVEEVETRQGHWGRVPSHPQPDAPRQKWQHGPSSDPWMPWNPRTGGHGLGRVPASSDGPSERSEPEPGSCEAAVDLRATGGRQQLQLSDGRHLSGRASCQQWVVSGGDRNQRLTLMDQWRWCYIPDMVFMLANRLMSWESMDMWI